MINEEKLKIFEYYLNKIQTDSIKEFTKFCLLRIPDYFYYIPASSTGLNHGKDEKLTGHILGCLYAGEKIAYDQFKNHWTQKQRDQLFSALILHDSFRAGEPENECRITEEDLTKYKLSRDYLGNFKTSRDHPEIAFRKLIKFGIEYNKYAEEKNLEKISLNNLGVITKAVRFHMGPFYETKDVKFSLSWPFDTVVVQVHNLDMLNTANAKYFTNKKEEEK